MTICDKPISRNELREMAESGFGDMVKGVVDIGRGLLAIDADLGINLYPDEEDDFVEFDSLINIRPMSGNRSRGVDDPDIQQRILEVVDKWTTK